MKIFDTKQLIENARNIDLNKKIGYISNIQSLDEIARISKQQLTIITARANSGKSTFIDFYCYMIAKHSNVKTLYISYETDATFHTKLLLRYCNTDLLLTNLMFADTTELNSIENIIEVIQYAKDNFNIDNVVIDPFNFVSTDQTSDTNQICKVLKELKQTAVKNDISVILVAHPKKLQADEQITGESINGSIHFRNIADLILVLTTNFESRETTIKVDKLRYNKIQGEINKTVTLKYCANGTFVESDNIDVDLFLFPATKEKVNNTIIPTEVKEVTKNAINEEVISNITEINDIKEKTNTIISTVKDDVIFTEEEIKEEIKEEPIKNITPAMSNKINSNDYEEYDFDDFMSNCTNFSVKQTINSKVDFLQLMQTKVSYLNSVYDKQPIEITLQEALTTKAEEVISKQAELRKLIEKEEIQAYKRNNLPLFSPSVVFSPDGTTANNIKQVNNIICIDIDAQDNNYISAQQMKEIVKNIPYVFYAQESASGKGIFCLIAIKDRNKFKEHFNALVDLFQQHNLVIDKQCNDINRKRFICHDKQCYVTRNAIIFEDIKEVTKLYSNTEEEVKEIVKTNKQFPSNWISLNDKDKAEYIADYCLTNNILLNKNHKDTLKLCSIYSSIYGNDNKGLDIVTKLRSMRKGIDENKLTSTYYNCQPLDYAINTLVTMFKAA